MSNIVVFSIIPWNPVVTQRPHHFSTLLGEAGHKVFYLNGFACGQHSKRVAKNVIETSLPDSVYFQFKKGTYFSEKNYQAIAELKPDIILVQVPFWSEYVKRFNCKIWYDILDHFAGFENLIENEEILNKMDAEICSSSFLVSYTARLLKPKNAHQSIYLPNACDFNHWNKPRTFNSKPVYFGVKAHWFNDRALAGLDCALIGPGTERGPVAYPVLPQEACKYSCGLLPFKNILLTRSTNPVKFYEYMALGIPIVATRLDELEHLSQDMPEDIRPVLLEEDVLFKDYIPMTDNLNLSNRRKEWAAENSWTERIKYVAGLLSL